MLHLVQEFEGALMSTSDIHVRERNDYGQEAILSLRSYAQNCFTASRYAFNISGCARDS